MGAQVGCVFGWVPHAGTRVLWPGCPSSVLSCLTEYGATPGVSCEGCLGGSYERGAGESCSLWDRAKPACVSLESLGAKVCFIFGSGSPLVG